jgi:hypothetical protein
VPCNLYVYILPETDQKVNSPFQKQPLSFKGMLKGLFGSIIFFDGNFTHNAIMAKTRFTFFGFNDIIKVNLEKFILERQHTNEVPKRHGRICYQKAG